MFQYLRLSQAIGGARTACERLPAAPAVYAWFRGIDLELTTPNGFLASLADAIQTRAAPDQQARLGHMYQVTLESVSRLSRSKALALNELSQNLRFREYLNSLLGTAALLQAPLYVGKAQALQTRIRQHLDVDSDLSVRFMQADISIERCTLAYALVDEACLPVMPDDSLLRLFEEIITCICRPGFVLRPG